MRRPFAELALAGALSLACGHHADARDPGQRADICLIAGDSIALDIARHAPQCAADAKIGIGSAAIVARVHPAPLVVISAGSNDPDNPRLVRNLTEIRVRAGFSRVVWGHARQRRRGGGGRCGGASRRRPHGRVRAGPRPSASAMSALPCRCDLRAGQVKTHRRLSECPRRGGASIENRVPQPKGA